MTDNEQSEGGHFAKDGQRVPSHMSPDLVRPDESTAFMIAAGMPHRSSVEDDEIAAFLTASSEPADPVLFDADTIDIPDLMQDDSGDTVCPDAATRAAKSSNMVSILVIISRITGFFRTSAQAWALGLTGLASTYTVAYAMPNTLYELVMGGMLITSFLPVYLSVKKKLGKPGACAYASNLLSLVLIMMAVLTVISFIFAAPIIWTQSAGAAAGFDFDMAVWFFRWFVCEIILYALSSIISGVLNAERDYFWSNAAPVLNNIITIFSFVLYGYLVNVRGVAWRDAVIVLAIGNPLGVAVQVFAQVPALIQHGVKLRLRVDIHDPALRETLSIGLPTLVVMLASFPTTAVMSSCALSVTPAGASISYYSRVWYVLPYSVFAIPISVTMFTELSNCRVIGDTSGFISCLASGMRKILFTLIPFAMFLIVFAPTLIAVFASGKFTAEATAQTAGYLQALSLALPFYGLSSYLQKVCSSMLRMRFYALATCVGAILQVAVCLVLTPVWGLYVVPVSSAVYMASIDALTLIRLRQELGSIGIRSVLGSVFYAVLFGALGSLAGWGILRGLCVAFGPCSGAIRGVLYAAVGGIPALLVTFGGSYLLGKSEAPFFDAIFGRIFRFKRSRTVQA